MSDDDIARARTDRDMRKLFGIDEKVRAVIVLDANTGKLLGWQHFDVKP